jgi:hypothetical protein
MPKLTLSADAEVVEMAKKLASQQGTSVSALFSQFILSLGDKPTGKKIGPITRQMTGIAKGPKGKSDRQLLAEALVKRQQA